MNEHCHLDMKILNYSKEKTDNTVNPYEYKDFGIVYVVYDEWIRNPETDEMPYKIGHTEKVSAKKRYVTLILPGEIKTLFEYRIKDYKRVEKELHEKYKKSCVNGEWFNLSQEEVYSIQDYCVNNDGVLVTDEVKKEIKRIEEEDRKINNALGSMGKTIFVKYYDQLKNNSREDVLKYIEAREKIKTAGSRISNGQRIFKEKLEKRALTIISEAKKVDKETRNEALRLLNVE
jgi:hypothetical protein